MLLVWLARACTWQWYHWCLGVCTPTWQSAWRSSTTHQRRYNIPQSRSFYMAHFEGRHVWIMHFRDPLKMHGIQGVQTHTYDGLYSNSSVTGGNQWLIWSLSLESTGHLDWPAWEWYRQDACVCFISFTYSASITYYYLGDIPHMERLPLLH